MASTLQNLAQTTGAPSRNPLASQCPNPVQHPRTPPARKRRFAKNLLNSDALNGPADRTPARATRLDGADVRGESTGKLFLDAPRRAARARRAFPLATVVDRPMRSPNESKIASSRTNGPRIESKRTFLAQEHDCKLAFPC